MNIERDDYIQWEVIWYILKDKPSWVEKLSKLRATNTWEFRHQIDRYIVAACRELKIKILPEDRTEIWSQINRRIGS